MFFIFFIFSSFVWGNFQHAVSLNGTPKYKKDFSYFSYINPDTKKGGHLKLSTLLPFNSLNPFILNGITPEHLAPFTVATLFEPSEDEPASNYAYVADGIRISDDQKSVFFSINKKAVFSDGISITAEDILFSFETLTKKGHPNFKHRYQDVKCIKVHNPHLIEFVIRNKKNKNIPYLLGNLPILPKHFYKNHDFTKTSIMIPPTSGPYLVQKFTPGKKIIYKRNKNWWAQNLPTQKGRHNFDYIEELSYRDDNTRFEAFKSHEFDLRMELSVQNWAKRYNFKTYKKGKIKKIVLPDKFPKPVYGIVLNTRRKHLNNRNIRKALSLAFDFNWCNKNFFYDLMERSTSYFQLSKFSSGLKSLPQVLEILKEYKNELPSYILEKEELQNLTSDDYRKNIKHAIRLFEKEGYHIKNQKITDKTTDSPLQFVLITDSKRLEKIALFYKEQLKKHFGISLKVIFCDQQTYTKKIQTFDFDMAFDRSFTTHFHSLNPGQELKAYYGSQYADVEGSSNFSGIKNNAIDELIKKINYSTNNQIPYEDNVKALDYLLVQEYYRILGWYFDGIMVAYWNDSIKNIEKTVPYPKNIMARLSAH